MQNSLKSRPNISYEPKSAKHIEQTWPFAKGKTFRLGHWQSKNIADPYQHDQTVFDETCRLIQDCITDWKNIFKFLIFSLFDI